MIISRSVVSLGLMIAAWVGGSSALAADAPTPAAADMRSPQVPPAAPGVFSAQKRGPAGFHISVTGHTFTSRDAIEKYLAYRAAELTKAEQSDWFTLVEKRAKGDTAPVPKTDPVGPRFSFRMEYWRPLWRYKANALPAWKSWSPFSGSAFFAGDPKTVTAYEASADIVLHKGTVTGNNPLAFDADALSDFLVNQVSPPQ